MPNYPNVDALSQLIQKQAFYNAGGQDGPDTLDKIAQGTGIVDKTIMDVLAIKKANLDRKKVQTDIAEKQQGQTPMRDLAMPLTKANATITPDTTPEERANMESLYGAREAMGNTTLDQTKEMSEIERNIREKQIPNKKYITESAFRERIKKGEVLSPNEYQIVPDPNSSEKNRIYIPESEWRRRTANGEKLSASEYQIVPDPTATENAGTIPPAQAGLYTLSQESISGIDKANKVLFPDGTPNSFRRDIATKSNIPGSDLPVVGRVIPNAAPFNENAQNVNRWVGNALSARQLIQTGVAARPDETQTLVRRFMAGVLSDPSAAQQAFQELSNFYKDYDTVLTTRKAIPPKQTPYLDKLLGIDNQSNPQKTQTSTPGIGTIEDGYAFKGGDPSDSKNWVQVGK